MARNLLRYYKSVVISLNAGVYGRSITAAPKESFHIGFKRKAFAVRTFSLKVRDGQAFEQS